MKSVLTIKLAGHYVCRMWGFLHKIAFICSGKGSCRHILSEERRAMDDAEVLKIVLSGETESMVCLWITIRMVLRDTSV